MPRSIGGKVMGQRAVFKVDLTKIEGDGEFPCPLCKAVISPDDESGLTYEIVEVKTKEDSSIPEKLIIICKKCRSIIHVEGFETLKELGISEEDDS